MARRAYGFQLKMVMSARCNNTLQKWYMDRLMKIINSTTIPEDLLVLFCSVLSCLRPICQFVGNPALSLIDAAPGGNAAHAFYFIVFTSYRAISIAAIMS
jgi:hypothetical protein